MPDKSLRYLVLGKKVGTFYRVQWMTKCTHGGGLIANVGLFNQNLSDFFLGQTNPAPNQTKVGIKSCMTQVTSGPTENIASNFFGSIGFISRKIK